MVSINVVLECWHRICVCVNVVVMCVCVRVVGYVMECMCICGTSPDMLS